MFSWNWLVPSWNHANKQRPTQRKWIDDVDEKKNWDYNVHACSIVDSLCSTLYENRMLPTQRMLAMTMICWDGVVVNRFLVFFFTALHFVYFIYFPFWSIYLFLFLHFNIHYRIMSGYRSRRYIYFDWKKKKIKNDS